MADLKTKYLGLELKNPLIVGSSGLTNSVSNILELEKNGAAAVVLKSLFEEEINIELKENALEMNKPGSIYPEIYDFFDYDTVEDSVSKYLNLIREAKEKVSIPIIASINCVSSSEWTDFAKRIENAGADALEVNLFILPSDFTRSGEENEKVYFDVVEKLKKEVKIPISLKISYYFSNLGQTIQKLSETGIEGLVLFNKFYNPDINIDTLTFQPAPILSMSSDLPVSLRWIAIMANRVSCDMAASTGVHNGEAVIKQLLAGATVVQIVSTLYKNGPQQISKMLNELTEWMDKKSFNTLDQFRGKMSQAKTYDPAAYERVQFMKHYSEKELAD